MPSERPAADRSVLLFDVMGTLVHDPFHETMPAFFGMTLAELIEAKHPTAWLEFERGERDEESFLRDFFRDGRSYDHEGLVAAMRGAYTLLPGIDSLLDELVQEGVDLHLFSNYSSWYGYIEEATQLTRWAPWTYVSCDHGARKPERAAYARACSLAGVAPQDAVFVDDQRRNIEGARACGIDAIHFQDAGELRRELQRRELIAASS
jgi:FMN hydrolase / 5-amino-6-(5-phospho-D-ribitylamino)uracil phosphatase